MEFRIRMVIISLRTHCNAGRGAFCIRVSCVSLGQRSDHQCNKIYLASTIWNVCFQFENCMFFDSKKMLINLYNIDFIYVFGQFQHN